MTTDKIAAAIEANMPGVTPGEWEWVHESGLANFHTSIYSEGYKGLLIACGDQNGEHTEDMLHIALCNPANMAAMISERKAMREEIERLREALLTLKEAAEAQAVHNEETAEHYRAAYAAFPSAEGHRIFAEEYEAKAASIRAALKDRSIA